MTFDDCRGAMSGRDWKASVRKFAVAAATGAKVAMSEAVKPGADIWQRGSPRRSM